MGKKTILRLDDGVVLTTELLNNLQQILGKNLRVEEASIGGELQRSFKRRAEILEKAFQFIVDVIPNKYSMHSSDKEKNWLPERVTFPESASIEKYNAMLSSYTASLVSVLIDHWKWDSETANIKSAAIELLNTAEQYVIAVQGRENLATVSRCAVFDRDNLILQWDRQLPPFSKKTLEELSFIKKQELVTTPPWFRSLPYYQQIFFHQTPISIDSLNTLKSNVLDLINRWNDSSKLLSPGVLQEQMQDIRNGINLPLWFQSMAPAHQAVILSLASSFKNEADVSEKLKALDSFLGDMQRGRIANTIPQLPKIRKLPYWFLCLPDETQQLLKSTLSRRKTVEEALSFLPSRLRLLPGLANAAVHDFRILSGTGEQLDALEPCLRSSHIASRDVRHLPSQIGTLHTQRNLEHLCDIVGHQSLLLQTLVSPIPISQLDEHLPDYYLNQQKIAAVHALRQVKSEAVFSTNHPLNKARLIQPTSASDEECNKLLMAAKNHLLMDAVKAKVAETELSDTSANILEHLTLATINFVVKNKPSNCHIVFNELFSYFLNHCGGEKLDLSASELNEFVDQAFNEAKAIKQKAHCESLGTLLVSEINQQKRRLVDFLVNHYEHFVQWEDWQPLFAQHLLLLNHPVHEKEWFIASTEKYIDLVLLIKEYEGLLNSGLGSATFLDYYGRELFLSSLEGMLIINMGGRPYGSCVSGKDREALHLIHLNAMWLYRQKYGRWPSINDAGSERANFVELVVLLYASGHHHEHAGQNAPGSDGIKTPGGYFPADIVNAIREKLGADALYKDDTLATNNEVRKIERISSRIKSDYVSCTMAARCLKETSREQLIEKIKAIVGESQFWRSKKSYSFYSTSPRGIAKVKMILAPENLSDRNNYNTINIIADIYHALSQRPTYSPDRHPLTQQFYNIVLGLYVHKSPEELVDDALADLEEIKQSSYASNSLA